MTDETWTGATIKVYEQRLSGNGEYDLVTGKYGTGKASWTTAEFDGKADKVIVTSEYLGEVVRKDPVTKTLTIALDDAGDNNIAVGRSSSTNTEIAGILGDFAVGDIVRVTPKLVHNSLSIPGAYTAWIYSVDTDKNVATYNEQYWVYNTADNAGKFVLPGSAISRKFNAEFDVFKPDTKSVTPGSYKYSYKSNQSAQQGNLKGHYIQTTSSGEKTWISGTYQEVLRAANAELFADGSKYTVYLDANGAILGGFSLSGGEYAVLKYPISNANSKRSEWDWVNNANADPRYMTYFLNDAFKTLDTSLPSSNATVTKSRADIYNGIRKQGTSIEGDGQVVKTGTVARLWGSEAKILSGYSASINGSSLPSDGALYVLVSVAAYVTPTSKLNFTPVSASEAAQDMKAKDRLGNNYHVYVYEDIDESDGTYITDYKVYVIDYTFGTTNGDSTAYVFSAQNIGPQGSGGNSGAKNLAKPVGAVSLVAATGAAAEFEVMSNNVSDLIAAGGFKLTFARPTSIGDNFTVEVKFADWGQSLASVNLAAVLTAGPGSDYTLTIDLTAVDSTNSAFFINGNGDLNKAKMARVIETVLQLNVYDSASSWTSATLTGAKIAFSQATPTAATNHYVVTSDDSTIFKVTKTTQGNPLIPAQFAGWTITASDDLKNAKVGDKLVVKGKNNGIEFTFDLTVLTPFVNANTTGKVAAVAASLDTLATTSSLTMGTITPLNGILAADLNLDGTDTVRNAVSGVITDLEVSVVLS